MAITRTQLHIELDLAKTALLGGAFPTAKIYVAAAAITLAGLASKSQDAGTSNEYKSDAALLGELRRAIDEASSAADSANADYSPFSAGVVEGLG